MDITAVKTRLTEIQAAITGVKRAYVNAPMSIPEEDLPLFMNYTGPAANDYDLYGDGEINEAREFVMRLYVAPIQSGLSGEAEAKVEPFFPLVYAAFAARPGLSSAVTGHTSPLAGIKFAFITADGGVSVLPFAGGNFIGAEFRIRVTDIQSYTLAQGE
jgi:hypothetical protein